jgi:hypothetical protein
MIDALKGFPDDVVAFAAHRKMSTADYAEAALPRSVPAVARVRDRTG